ncbi:hypothetical protein ABEF95_006026 [Exophiala dermatitidis]|uniref:Uncharacterized protein n=2 Tax=Exophiala dermatitidis TaxID=5970 RepID=H6BYU3_EXODN|nr:uncharacterized protein HMPREF1120_04873 [Exophiala dermatitidis NIH/UT8656]EHY56807.1 hypothetical protein HMPREF1120_04873 [Exophiala dermatitidis NIH/UT8656]
MDKSQITKHRRSLGESDHSFEHRPRFYRQEGQHAEERRSPREARSDSYQQPRKEVRRERSLSPYSKRLALTQAMNM